MRLQQYLLGEARVKQTNAEIFLKEYVPTFVWSDSTGLLWSIYKDSKWIIYKNNKEIKKVSSNKTYFAHWELMKIVNKEFYESNAISGRIHPEGRTIFINGFNYKENPILLAKKFNKRMNKAINAVYKYMGDYIT